MSALNQVPVDKIMALLPHGTTEQSSQVYIMFANEFGGNEVAILKDRYNDTPRGEILPMIEVPLGGQPLSYILRLESLDTENVVFKRVGHDELYQEAVMSRSDWENEGRPMNLYLTLPANPTEYMDSKR